MWAWTLNNRIVNVFPDSTQEDVTIAAQGNYLTTEVPDTAEPGWTYDVVADEWVAPPFVPPVPNRVLSVIVYKQRFTFQERAAIYSAADTDPIVAELVRSLDDPRLTEINLDHAETVAGVDYLIATAVLSGDRRAAILADVV